MMANTENMPIFCSHCAYENDVHYRFCGMCGTPLSQSAAGSASPGTQAGDTARYDRQDAASPSSAQVGQEGYRAGDDPRPPKYYSYEGSPSQRLRESLRRESLRHDPLSRDPLSEDTRVVAPPQHFEGQDDRTAEDERAEPVSGPSFLGLSGPSQPDVGYLLQDDSPPAGRRRMALALVILLIAAAALGWHWYHNGLPWLALNRGSAPSNSINSSNSGKPSDAATSAPLPPDDAGQGGQSQTGAGETIPLHPSDNAANVGNKPRETDIAPPNQSNAAAPADSGSEPGAKQETTASDASSDSDKSDKDNAGKDENTPAAAPAAKIRPVNRPETTTPKRPRAEDAVPTPAPSDTDALASEGEKYLYGNGVPQNCARAQKDLLTAAGKSNAHAQTLLGAMHATGHCVDRDLPAAYRWFAKALHQDPSNRRIERDLEILWKQMTPEEKQLASAKQ
jgi:hypothetical protein